MSAGAIIAATAAAAAAQRLQKVYDVFRVAGATSEDRAQSLEELGLANYSEVGALAESGALVRARGRDRWWLDESVVIARRDAVHPNRRLLMGVIGALLVVLGALVVLIN